VQSKPAPCIENAGIVGVILLTTVSNRPIPLKNSVISENRVYFWDTLTFTNGEKSIVVDLVRPFF
jgi:hypothetical protein